MPNTLGHIGIQTLATRGIIRGADVKWIYLGCIIPDLPWILQRAVLTVLPGIDALALRYYCDVQASLLFCLILSAALALPAVQSGRIFAILGSNALLHLLLDASQIKWGNGVHLLAPFSWEASNWGWFWPDSFSGYFLTALGLAALAGFWRRAVNFPAGLRRPPLSRLILLMILGASYYLMPFWLMTGPEKAGLHDGPLVRDPALRPGQLLEIDRAPYQPGAGGGYITSRYLGQLRVQGMNLGQPATVSIRGRFIGENEIGVLEYHRHRDGFRDGASYLGLALIAFTWVWYFRRHSGRGRTGEIKQS